MVFLYILPYPDTGTHHEQEDASIKCDLLPIQKEMGSISGIPYVLLSAVVIHIKQDLTERLRLSHILLFQIHSDRQIRRIAPLICGEPDGMEGADRLQ